MCWSLRISLLAACYGFGMSIYFVRRKFSNRDPWYGAFLCSFTLTQLLDAFFWSLAGDSEQTLAPEVPCTTANLVFTKLVVSSAVFSQVYTITLFPTSPARGELPRLRRLYRLLPVVGAAAMAVVGRCTYSMVTTGGMLQLPTLVYWGMVPSPLLFFAGVLLWSSAALLFITPIWAATNILLVGGLNLLILWFVDGNIRLVSKLCFYCLQLSILWLIEPFWAPPEIEGEERRAVVGEGPSVATVVRVELSASTDEDASDTERKRKATKGGGPILRVPLLLRE